MIRTDLLSFEEVVAVAQCLSGGRCPACHGRRRAFVRSRDGMWVCAGCDDWAYRDLATGRVLYPFTKEEMIHG